MSRSPDAAKRQELRPMDPARQHHAYGGVEHTSAPPVEGCLLCTLEAVATAWFEWDQQALDALLHDYRQVDPEDLSIDDLARIQRP